MKRSAFTMVELIFIIVILGILASVAIPKLAVTRTDALIAKGKSDVSAIRSSIITKRSQNLLSGITDFPDLNGTANGLFSGVLDYPIESGKSGWTSTSSTDYTFKASDINVTFKYNKDNGIFTCAGITDNDNNAQKKDLCSKLTQ